MGFISGLKQRAKALRSQTLTVYFASRDPRLPVYVKVIAILVVAYALSPIDLIPDVIPVLGLLDDLVIVPLGLALVVWLTPPEVLQAARERAAQSFLKPVSYAAALVFILCWLLLLVVLARWLFAQING